MPFARRYFDLTSITNTIANAHGGLIMLSVDKTITDMQFDITFENVIEVPHFKLGEGTFQLPAKG